MELSTAVSALASGMLALSAWGQTAKTPEPPAAPVTVTASEPRPDETTETLSIPGVLLGRAGQGTPEAYAQTVALAIAQASGARVTPLTSRQLVVTGTSRQMTLAKETLERLGTEAKDANDRANEADARRREAQAKADAPKEDKLSSISIDFPGGTIADYLELVTRASEFASFVIDDDRIPQFPLRAMKMRNVDLRTALDLLSNMKFRDSEGTAAEIYISWVGPGSGRYDGNPAAEAKNIARSVCVLRVNEPSTGRPGQGGRSTQKEPPKTERAVFDLSSMDSLPKDDLQRLLDAVSVAVELDGASATFRAKFHEPSKFLIVRGTPDELGLVRQILRTRVPTVRDEVAAQASAATALPASAAPGSTDPVPTKPTQAKPRQQ